MEEDQPYHFYSPAELLQKAEDYETLLEEAKRQPNNEIATKAFANLSIYFRTLCFARLKVEPMQPT